MVWLGRSTALTKVCGLVDQLILVKGEVMKEPLPYFMGLKKQNDASTRLSVVLYKGVAA